MFDASPTNDTPTDKKKLRYYWCLGDGEYAEGKTIVHRYARSGEYSITLVVIDDDGAKSMATAKIKVLNIPPNISITIEREAVYEGETWIFKAESWDTQSDFPILNYTWSTGGEGWRTITILWDDTESAITVRVIDDDGAEAESEIDVAVGNVAPEIFIYDAVIDVNLTVRIAGERWHDVTLYIYRDGVLVKNVTIVREEGCPDDQAITFPIVFTPYDNWTAVAVYTPLDDPENGNELGANPFWLNFSFPDPDWYNESYLCDNECFKNYVLLHHTFVVAQNDTWVWEANLNEIFMHLPITFIGRIFDQGMDGQYLEIYVNRTIVAEYNISPSMAPVDEEVRFSALFFPVHCTCDGCTTMDCCDCRKGKTWYSNIVLFNVTDDDCGWDTAEVYIYNDSGWLAVYDLAPRLFSNFLTFK